MIGVVNRHKRLCSLILAVLVLLFFAQCLHYQVHAFSAMISGGMILLSIALLIMNVCYDYTTQDGIDALYSIWCQFDEAFQTQMNDQYDNYWEQGYYEIPISAIQAIGDAWQETYVTNVGDFETWATFSERGLSWAQGFCRIGSTNTSITDNDFRFLQLIGKFDWNEINFDAGTEAAPVVSYETIHGLDMTIAAYNGGTGKYYAKITTQYSSYPYYWAYHTSMSIGNLAEMPVYIGQCYSGGSLRDCVIFAGDFAVGTEGYISCFPGANNVGVFEASVAAEGDSLVYGDDAEDVIGAFETTYPDTVNGDMIMVDPTLGALVVAGGVTLADIAGLTQADIAEYTDTDTGTETDTSDPPDIPDEPPGFRNLIITKFPFCLPWDLAAAIELLSAEPEAPHWSVDFTSAFSEVPVQESILFTIDFSDYEFLGQLSRWFFTITFCIALIMVTRKLTGT